jgi:hypothetical protein
MSVRQKYSTTHLDQCMKESTYRQLNSSLFWGLVFELRALHLVVKCSTTWATPPAQQRTFIQPIFIKYESDTLVDAFTCIFSSVFTTNLWGWIYSFFWLKGQGVSRERARRCSSRLAGHSAFHGEVLANSPPTISPSTGYSRGWHCSHSHSWILPLASPACPPLGIPPSPLGSHSSLSPDLIRPQPGSCTPRGPGFLAHHRQPTCWGGSLA